MKPKMKYTTSKISPAKLKSSAEKSLVKSCKLRKSQNQAEEICHVYYMRLRSGLTIKKKACNFRKRTTKRCSQKTGRQHKETAAYQQPDEQYPIFAAPRNKGHSLISARCATSDNVHGGDEEGGTSPIVESCASLSTYYDKCVRFVLEDGSYVINVEDLGKDEEKDKVLLRFYESSYSSGESGDGVDGKMSMVNLSPTKDTDFWLHANTKKRSVELQKGKSPLPDQAFFVLHKDSSEFVSFECKSNRGTYIGVKNNRLALIEEESMTSENIRFRLSPLTLM
ncbi:interleukin-33 isoform X2 [Dipodomys spectabilis]|uniref:interleukin-33 isoform X2 n=1 Tax=Dipodomys spectabilis TaxID=105255 RepID=UPI001C546A05|nr:interleukin-33 isoform X2 [Dipodomys spectabilis]